MTKNLRLGNNNKRYYLISIGFVSGIKLYKFSESRKSEAFSLKRRYELEGIPVTLTVIEPKVSSYQLSLFS